MGRLEFKVLSKEGMARSGILRLKHGTVQTPELMPVATNATVKAVPLDQLQAQMLICNTYHLMLKPGADIVEELGGLHRFMNWNKPLATDSGGFQAFSLGLGKQHGPTKMYKPRKNEQLRPGKPLAMVTEKGVHFRSIHDNSRQFLTPKRSIEVQEKLGADMILTLDECTSPLSDKAYVKKSLERTNRWALECLAAHTSGQALAGIVQGSHWKDLRKQSARFIASQPFDAIAIGGSLGKTKKDMHSILEWVVEELPEGKPRHLLGIGVVEDIFEAVDRGIDLFDCVSPTRLARCGYAYVRPPLGNLRNKFRVRLTAGSFKKDSTPIDPECSCQVCKLYSRAYINHLFNAKELLAFTLLSHHNLSFFLRLTAEMRAAIKKRAFADLKARWGV